MIFIPVCSQQTLGIAHLFLFYLESKVSRLCSTTFPLQSSRHFQPVEPGFCKTSTSTVPVLWQEHCACRPFGLRSEKVQWDYKILNLIMRGKRIRQRERYLVKWVESCFCLLLNMNTPPHTGTVWGMPWSNPKKLLGTFHWLMDVFHNLMEFSLLSLFKSQECPCPSITSLRNTY